MKNDNFIELFENITNSYYMVTSKMLDEKGRPYYINQYVAGNQSDKSFTVIRVNDFKEYIAVDIDGLKTPICYSYIYTKKKILANSDIVLFGVKNPKELTECILNFLRRNEKNISVHRSLYFNPPVKLILKIDEISTSIAEIVTDRTTYMPFEYLHFNYRNIDVNIQPITQKKFEEATSLYNYWVKQDIEAQSLNV